MAQIVLQRLNHSLRAVRSVGQLIAARTCHAFASHRLSCLFCQDLQKKVTVPFERAYTNSTSLGSYAEREDAIAVLTNNKKAVTIAANGSASTTYHAVWLRHHCSCPKCMHPKSGRPLMPPENLLESYTIEEAKVFGDSLVVTWEEEQDHRSTYQLSWLAKNEYGEEKVKKLAIEARPKPLQGMPKEFSFEAIVSSDTVRLEWLQRILEDGLVVVRDVPSKEDAVADLGRQIFELRGNNYGNMHSLVSEDFDKTDDQTYSTLGLELHQDVPYYESPPGLELLHCYKRSPSVVGGESVYVDTMHVAEQFRDKYPEDFNVLATVPVRLGVLFKNLNFTERPIVHFQRERPLITLGLENEITAVFWDPGTELPLCTKSEMVEPYYRARKRFLNMIITSPLKKEFILEEGKMTVYNNRRFVHSRYGFQLNGGIRHVVIGYINIDEFKSELYSLCLRNGRPIPCTRVGDQNYIF